MSEKIRQTDKVCPANTRQNIDKVRPANTAKLSTNKSTKFARRRSRLSSTCQYNATIDKVRRNFRLNSPCKCNAIDNARQANSVMLNATLIA